MADEVSMKKNEIEQESLNSATYLTDLEMKVKVKEMSLGHLKAEVANERRLDSIGSGTGDRIRQAELAYSTARLELDQLKTQLANEKKAHAVAYRSKQLEGTISARNLETMGRTLDDARVKAPRKGTVTWLNKNLGTSIGAGEKLAVVSDLGHFKIEGEIPEQFRKTCGRFPGQRENKPQHRQRAHRHHFPAKPERYGAVYSLPRRRQRQTASLRA